MEPLIIEPIVHTDADKNASSIADIARSVEHDQIAEKAAAKAKEGVMEALQEVFGYSDKAADSPEMTVLIRRIPLICQDVRDMKEDISEIKGNTQWVVRLILGAVLVALLSMVIPHLSISLP